MNAKPEKSSTSPRPSFVTEFDFIQPQNTIENGLKSLVAEGRLKTGDMVVIIGAISVGTEIVDAVQMRTV